MPFRLLRRIQKISPFFRPEEEYIIQESPEIAVGQSRYLSRLFRVLPALQSRNYQLYFSGQMISMIGTWLQIVAQGWLVLQLTNSALDLGIIAALSAFPTLLFSLFGGVIVDRFYKKDVLIFTQSAAMILAFILGILTLTKTVTVWEIGLLAFLLGTVTAIDSPARNSFIVEMVPKHQLTSAIALNSGIFNAARVIGPAVAGILIATVGTGGAFIINGASYIAVIIALVLMKVEKYAPKRNLNPIEAIKEGVKYSFSHPIIRMLLVFIAVVSVFGWSYTTILPLIAQNSFHVGAGGLGQLYVSTGLGALVAILIVSALADQIRPAVFIFGGNLLFAAGLILFAFSPNFLLANICLFFAGSGIISQFATMNTTIQHLVPNDIRGRVMSIYTLMFLGFAPLGNFEIGFLSDRIGPGPSILLGAVIVLAFGALIYSQRMKIDAAYSLYRRQNRESLDHKFF